MSIFSGFTLLQYHRLFFPYDVASLQRDLGVKPDGKRGPKTEKALVEAADFLFPAVCAALGWKWNPTAATHGDGLTLARKPILHWPVAPVTAAACATRWEKNARPGGSQTGSHVSIDETQVIWTAAPHRRTNHAQGQNRHTLGVDIAVPVTLDYREAAERRGIYAGERDGLLLLHPRVADRTAELMRMVCHLANVPFQLGWKKSSPVTDHATVDETGRVKIDCIIWREELERAWLGAGGVLDR